MPELKSSEVKDICFSNLKRYFNGEITKEQLDNAVHEVERQLAPGTVPVASLFDPVESSKGG